MNIKCPNCGAVHCAHADFETTKGSEMQGFAKCLKARDFIERAMYHPRSDRCDKGKFEAASPEEAAKREGWDGN